MALRIKLFNLLKKQIRYDEFVDDQVPDQTIIYAGVLEVFDK